MSHARVLWRYLAAPPDHHREGLLVVCGSYDLRVCDHACDLFERGHFDRLVITGRTGNWTRHLWSETEARVFAERARRHGLPDSSMLLETQATNFAENIRNVRLLVPSARKVTFVTKLNSIRRIIATAPIQWPDADVRADGPPIRFPDEVSNIVGVFGVIAEMVGDIDRLINYPAAGFQVPSDVPDDVLTSFRYLAGHGFDSHMLSPTA
ncbi:YdcF family protein [Modicisalibacter radicis]|uniref:YdcF family protein n=1 Tax=Halomonas sp. EAR18 TaxID=2518972 RepID=UPI001B34E526|nr:YdcF family protein [Halomonas sp. EAR18]